MPLFDLGGQVAIVAGATKGIGRGILGRLADSGGISTTGSCIPVDGPSARLPPATSFAEQLEEAFEPYHKFN